MKRQTPLLFAAVAALFMSGCSLSRPVITETVTATNGVATSRSLRVTQFALWPATQTVAKQRATLGKTFSFGSEGLELDGGGTNLVDAFNAATRLLNAAKPVP